TPRRGCLRVSRASLDETECLTVENGMGIGAYLVQQLQANGVRHVFGVPGDYALGFYDQLVQSPLRVVNTCDEQAAGFAADAYARVSGLGGGFAVKTEQDLDEALAAAEQHTDSFCLLDVRLDPLDGSPALRRLTERLGKRL